MANAEGDGSESKETECDSEPECNGVVRRPMNAFLIFCKRHRSLVREKYPHMENRSITKILGEWWANLEADEKVTYTDLAKQYKEAFMKANPDFRWYKLPAPTSRTLVTRPSNQRSSKVDSTATANFSGANKCGITPGKLADETQLGGLNSLITQPCSSSTSSSSSSSSNSSSSLLSKPPKKRYLQNGAFVNSSEITHISKSDPQTTNACSALLELASICSSKGSLETHLIIPNVGVVPEKEKIVHEKEATVSNQQLINCIIDNTIGAPQEPARLNGTTKLFPSHSTSKFGDDDYQFVNKGEAGVCRKSERKGKGKRYQALLSEGFLHPPKDRRHANNVAKRSNELKEEKGDLELTLDESKSLNIDAQIAALPRCSFDALMKKKRKTDIQENDDDRLNSDTDSTKDIDGGMMKESDQTSDTDPMDENDGKTRFQTGGFDLEKQIAALPSLNIDLLNQRKKQQRQKNVPGGVPRNANKNKGGRSPEYESNRSDTRPTLVGSQKRKARKRSITHLNPTSDHKPHTSVVEPTILNSLSTIGKSNE